MDNFSNSDDILVAPYLRVLAVEVLEVVQPTYADSPVTIQSTKYCWIKHRNLESASARGAPPLLTNHVCNPASQPKSRVSSPR